MKRKLKVAVILMFLFGLIPIFSGCSGTEVAEFEGYSVCGKEEGMGCVAGLVTEPWYSDLNNHIFTSRVKIKSDKVQSFKKEVKAHKNGTYFFETKYSRCTNVKGRGTSVSKINESYLEDDSVLYVEYTFYDGADCETGEGKQIGVLKTPRIHTYLRTEDIVDTVTEQGYCNVDANGTYKDLGEQYNLFERIAYSQVGYQGKSSEDTIDKCSSYGELAGFYNKYGQSKNENDISIDFIEWVAKKAGIFSALDKEIKLPKTGNEILTLAKSSSRFYTEVTNVKRGDLVILNYTCFEGKGFSIRYDRPTLGIVVNDSPKKAVTTSSDKLTNTSIVLEDVFPYDFAGFYYDDGTPIASCEQTAVGYISMEGIAY